MVRSSRARPSSVARRLDQMVSLRLDPDLRAGLPQSPTRPVEVSDLLRTATPQRVTRHQFALTTVSITTVVSACCCRTLATDRPRAKPSNLLRDRPGTLPIRSPDSFSPSRERRPPEPGARPIRPGAARCGEGNSDWVTLVNALLVASRVISGPATVRWPRRDGLQRRRPIVANANGNSVTKFPVECHTLGRPAPFIHRHEVASAGLNKGFVPDRAGGPRCSRASGGAHEHFAPPEIVRRTAIVPPARVIWRNELGGHL